jgi:hypothetical protein
MVVFLESLSSFVFAMTSETTLHSLSHFGLESNYFCIRYLVSQGAEWLTFLMRDPIGQLALLMAIHPWKKDPPFAIAEANMNDLDFLLCQSDFFLFLLCC